MSKNLIFKKKKDFLFIAEVGSSHLGNFRKAKKIVKLACESGAHCIKLQIFTAKNMVNPKYDIKRYEHFKKLELKDSQYIELLKIIKRNKKISCVSIWDKEIIKKFNNYVDYYKIGSGDLNNFEIIDKIIKFKKPIIISTGLSDITNTQRTIKFIQKRMPLYKNRKKIAILHCNTAYPTPINDSLLGTIDKLYKKFKLTTGYSDHLVGDSGIIYAHALGAKIIEKHFTDNIKDNRFRDNQISLDKKGVINFLKKVKFFSSSKKLNQSKSEKKQNNKISFGRSIYAKKNILKGEKFSKENVISLRPFKGISASFIFQIYGKRAKKNFKPGDVIIK
jgi:N,N'-diacetyllegionaminate synthase